MECSEEGLQHEAPLARERDVKLNYVVGAEAAVRARTFGQIAGGGCVATRRESTSNGRRRARHCRGREGAAAVVERSGSGGRTHVAATTRARFDISPTPSRGAAG